MKKNTQKGFTLVELLVVIAILAILATVSVVGYTAFIDRAEQSNADTEAAQIKSAITTALIADDYVVVTVDGAAAYITDEDGDGVIEIATTEPTTGKHSDLSTDLIAAGSLKVDGTNLVYTNTETEKTSVVLAVEE